MPVINFADYIDNLKKKIADLKQSLEKLSKDKLEAEMASELEKANLKKKVNQKLKKVEVNKLDLDYTDSLPLKISKEDINSALNEFYPV